MNDKITSSPRRGNKKIGVKGYGSLLLILAALASGCSNDGPAPGSGRLVADTLTVDFGVVTTTSGRVLPFIVRNTGTGSLEVTSTTVQGTNAADFTITSTRTFTIAAGGSEPIDIRFLPLGLGRRTATLTVRTATDSITVALRGIGREPGPAGDQVIAKLVSTPPKLDGDPSDQVWTIGTATPLRFDPVADESMADTFSAARRVIFNGEMRALYTIDSLYFLLSYDDPDRDDDPGRWKFIGGDPSSATNWQRSSTGVDGVSLIFPITSSVANDKGVMFTSGGCAVTCHATPGLDIYEGGHAPASGSIDLWYWRAGLTEPSGYADDQVASSSAGRRLADPGVTLYEPNYSSGGSSLPLRMAGSTNGGFDPTRILWRSSAISYDPSAINPATGAQWNSGDVIPAWVIGPPSDDRASVRVRSSYSGGKWYLEFARALRSSSDKDVLFDIDKIAQFGIAVHERQRKFSAVEYAALPNTPLPAHYGVALLQLIFD